ncbi:MAG: histidine--tRNA ligase [Gammaproteobacteria bacterium]
MKLQAIRGMNDLLPSESGVWQFVENTLKEIVSRYSYQEIRFPILEQTALFKRSVGEATDIVEKEMYTFDDRNGDSLSMRPEGTAGCVRAGIEHGLLYNQIAKLWYLGPFYRHERPQKGRYRQFHQFGAEAFGIATPDIDAELIIMSARCWEALGINDLKLEINSMGTSECRDKFREVIREYFSKHQSQLDQDSLRRLDTNPLRILDSKHPDMQALIHEAPKFTEHLDDDSKQFFDTVCDYLAQANINFEINPYIVRGLDYYSHTVFEWTTDKLGAQNTICAGGRYDGLVEQLGGHATPGVGFAIGLERLIALIEANQDTAKLNATPDFYVIIAGETAQRKGLAWVEKLRSALPSKSIQAHCGGGSFKSQFKKADKSGARYAIILGDDEITSDQVTIKALREQTDQKQLDFEALVEWAS